MNSIPMKPETFTLFWRICKQMKESGKVTKVSCILAHIFPILSSSDYSSPNSMKPTHSILFLADAGVHTHTHTHTHTHMILGTRFYSSSSQLSSNPCPVPISRFLFKGTNTTDYLPKTHSLY